MTKTNVAAPQAFQPRCAGAATPHPPPARSTRQKKHRHHHAHRRRCRLQPLLTNTTSPALAPKAVTTMRAPQRRQTRYAQRKHDPAHHHSTGAATANLLQARASLARVFRRSRDAAQVRPTSRASARPTGYAIPKTTSADPLDARWRKSAIADHEWFRAQSIAQIHARQTQRFFRLTPQ